MKRPRQRGRRKETVADEAIKELDLYLLHSDEWQHERLDIAIKLGIEALKRLKDLRTEEVFRAGILLPGETEE